jgi:hypothetical protein
LLLKQGESVVGASRDVGPLGADYSQAAEQRQRNGRQQQHPIHVLKTSAIDIDHFYLADDAT